jgi:hypothetical protein
VLAQAPMLLPMCTVPPTDQLPPLGCWMPTSMLLSAVWP